MKRAIVVAAAVSVAVISLSFIGHKRLVVDGNPMPPFPPKVWLVDGNPMPPFPRGLLFVADGNPMPPFPSKSASQSADVLAADGNPMPPFPPSHRSVTA